MRTGGRCCVTLIVVMIVAGCHRIPSTTPAEPRFWYVAAANGAPHDGGHDANVAKIAPGTGAGGLIVIDTASLRPVLADSGGRIGTGGAPALNASRPERFVTVSTYQGTRHHPETIRAIAGDSAATANAARSIAAMAADAGPGIMIDFQEAMPGDLPEIVETVRSIHAAVTGSGRSGRIAIVIPPGDTVSYPAGVLARVADLLVLRLHGEHRPGTGPGPLTTSEFIAREIGIRAKQIGTSRLAAELPLFGYLWRQDGTARPVSYAEAQALVLAEAGVFRRDPASGFLTANGRDGWTVWVPDGETVRRLIQAVERRGIRRIVLAGASFEIRD